MFQIFQMKKLHENISNKSKKKIGKIIEKYLR